MYHVTPVGFTYFMSTRISQCWLAAMVPMHVIRSHCGVHRLENKYFISYFKVCSLFSLWFQLLVSSGDINCLYYKKGLCVCGVLTMVSAGNVDLSIWDIVCVC